MTKGKHWTNQEETELKNLIEANTDLAEIAAEFKKTPGAIFLKCQRLGLKIQSQDYHNTRVPLPRELPSVEEALKMLAYALRTAIKPGLDRFEIQRLQAVATIAKTYEEILPRYINYREIETRLKKMEELNAQLLKESPNPTAQPDSAPVA
jgi:hypothetical protein